jgi:DNA modification methylase
MPEYRLHLGDCLEILPTIPDASVDAVISDPPYPEIDRPYGRMTEAAWHEMMREVVRQTRRILKPKGSAVFILQPNSRKVGSMRPWLFEFQAWCCREWNIVQDAYWWNTAAMPGDYGGLMRSSVKPCVWIGPCDCRRYLGSALWEEARMSKVAAACARARNAGRETSPSGRSVNRSKSGNLAETRGGVTPFNLLPTTHGQGKSASSAAAFGHGAGTPIFLADWWVRYISPAGGVVADWFAGSGTMGLAALKHGRSFIGVEKMPEYHAIAERRITEAMPLFA